MKSVTSWEVFNRVGIEIRIQVEPWDGHSSLGEYLQVPNTWNFIKIFKNKNPFRYTETISYIIELRQHLR